MSRVTCCQGQVLVEQFECVRNCQEQTDGNGRHNHRQFYFPKCLPAARTVDGSSFHQIRRYILQACNIDDHHITDLLPAKQNDQTPVTSLCIQCQQGFAQFHQNSVEQCLPDVTQNDTADQVWHKEYCSENICALQFFCQCQRNGKGCHVNDQRCHDNESNCEPEGIDKGCICQGSHIVIYAHKLCVIYRCKLAERQIQTMDEGPDKPYTEGSQCWCHEYRKPPFQCFFHGSSSHFLFEFPGNVNHYKNGGAWMLPHLFIFCKNIVSSKHN